jgi:hypothetical protein
MAEESLFRRFEKEKWAVVAELIAERRPETLEDTPFKLLVSLRHCPG